MSMYVVEAMQDWSGISRSFDANGRSQQRRLVFNARLSELERLQLLQSEEYLGTASVT